jgi:hypothetical protein
MGWWFGFAPATLELWDRFPNERNQENKAHPVSKYRVPTRVSPHANSFVIGTVVRNNNLLLDSLASTWRRLFPEEVLGLGFRTHCGGTNTNTVTP